MKLKVSKEEIELVISNQIDKLKEADDVVNIKRLFVDTEGQLEHTFEDSIISEKFKKEVLYQENEFSNAATRRNILKAKEKAIIYLESIYDRLQKYGIENNSESNEEFSQEIALLIIRKILNNFYSHIEEMYEAEIHGKSTIKKENLENITIGNEYDVQRILFSIIKPVFPEARLEVSDDAGYGTVRYDIVIDKYSVIIETKCSRESMTERKLTEEIGSDAFHYKYNNIFFFVYDKSKIIKNKAAFKEAYNKRFDDKNIEAVIIQPVKL